MFETVFLALPLPLFWFPYNDRTLFAFNCSFLHIIIRFCFFFPSLCFTISSYLYYICPVCLSFVNIRYNYDIQAFSRFKFVRFCSVHSSHPCTFHCSYVLLPLSDFFIIISYTDTVLQLYLNKPLRSQHSVRGSVKGMCARVLKREL